MPGSGAKKPRWRGLLAIHTIDTLLFVIVLAWAISLFLDPIFMKIYGAGIAVPEDLVYLLVGGSLGLRIPTPNK